MSYPVGGIPEITNPQNIDLDSINDPVSFEPMTEAVTLHCGHSYNFSTVKQWQERNMTCPECRKPIQGYSESYTIRKLAAQLSKKDTPEQSVENDQRAKNFYQKGHLQDQKGKEPQPSLPATLMSSALPSEQIQAAKSVSTLPKSLLDELNSVLEMSLQDVNSSRWDLSGKSLDRKKLQVLFKALQGSPYVNELILSTCSIDSQNIELLAEFLQTNTSLKKLDLSHNNIGNHCFRALIMAFSKNPRLRLVEINLRDVSLSNESLKMLCAWLAVVKSLQRLDLSDNSLSDDSVELLLTSFVKNQNLQLEELQIDNTPISQANALLLEKWLKTQKKIESLALCANSLKPTWSHTEYLELSDYLSKTDWHQLYPERLEHRQFEIQRGFEAGRYFLEPFQRDVNECHRDYEKMKAKQNREIIINKRLRARDVQPFLAAITQISQCLVRLSLAKSDIGSESAEQLGLWLNPMTTLRVLDLSGNRLIGEEKPFFPEKYFANLYLTELNFSENGEQVCRSLALWLRNTHTLTRLILGKNLARLELYQKEFLQEIEYNIREKANEHSPIWTCEKYPDKPRLGNPNPYFEEHYTRKLQEHQAQAALKAKNKLLEEGLAEITSLVQALSDNSRIPLEELNIEGLAMGPTGAALLGRWVAGNKTLKILNISNNFLGNEGVIAFCQAIGNKTPSCLEHLYLAHNALEDIPTRFALSEVLPENCSLHF